jgi:alkylated DNA repair dioxygenase AlkB
MAIHLDLFSDLKSSEVVRDLFGVPGLWYCPELLLPEEQSRILQEIDAHPWLDDLKRRVQHYGYKYDYKARRVDPSMFVGPLPEFAIDVAQKLLHRNMLEEMPDQLIVNEYQPGQGITAHVDCEPCFKNVIATVSLGSVYEMDFISVATGKKISLPLELGSALVFRDEARYQWTHRIQARRSEKWGSRHRRVSLTFRNVIINTSPNEDV